MYKVDLEKLLTKEEYERLKKVDANMFYVNPPQNYRWNERRANKNVKV